MKLNRYAGLLVIFLLFTGSPYAQNLIIGAQGGLSRAFGQGSEQFNTGYDFGGTVYFGLGKVLYLGVRGTYTNWSPDETDFLNDIFDVDSGTVEGDIWAANVMGVLRLNTNLPAWFNLFAETGAGISFFDSEVEISADPGDTTTTISSGSGTTKHFVLMYSLGISIGSPGTFTFDLFPTVNTLFLEDRNLWSYATFNVGITIGF
jgi:hypothetical protein